MEEKLGANWLNKIGTAAFVIGVALLLNYSMHLLGAGGKIALGYAISAILLTAGIIGEKKERYRIAGRAVLGGGWALAYFTTYALHNIASVRLVESPAIGFVLLIYRRRRDGCALASLSQRNHHWLRISSRIRNHRNQRNSTRCADCIRTARGFARLRASCAKLVRHRAARNHRDLLGSLALA